MLSVYKKKGISSRAMPDIGMEKTTYAEKIHSRWVAVGFGNTVNGSPFDFAASREICMGKVVLEYESNSSGTSSNHVKWRSSIAASTYRKRVNYVHDSGKCATEFSFGDYSNSERMAADTTKYLSGWRTAPVAGAAGVVGAPAVYYNSAQQKLGNQALCKSLGDPKIQLVNVTSAWKQVWGSYCLIRIAAQEAAVWNARPAYPTSISTQLSGLNLYDANMAMVQAGAKYQIEINEEDIDLIPYITFLMGASHNTFTNTHGAAGGNDRISHHSEHRLPVMPYDIYVKNTQTALPVNVATGAAMSFPGLAPAIVIDNTDVGVFDEDMLVRALLALCASLPIAEDCESAWLSTLIGVFAENYRGVADSEKIGSAAYRPGLDGLVRGGLKVVPSGNCVCNMFTFLTEGNATNLKCRQLVLKLVQMSTDLGNMRSAIEPLIMSFQHAARQVGFTGTIFFDKALHANMAAPSWVLPTNAASIASRVRSLACGENDAPGGLMYMTSLITERFFGGRLPASFLFFGVGDSSNDGNTPFQPNEEWGARRGQCLVSVHPAQINNSFYTKDVDGLPGIPYNLGDQASETGFTIVTGGTTFAVRNTMESYEAEGNEVEFENSIGALGHSVILRRDSNRDEGAEYTLIMTDVSVKDSTGVSVLHMQTEKFPRRMTRAFVSNSGTDRTGWDVGFDVCQTHMELYSDFDYFSSKELNLAIPSAGNGDIIANNATYRGHLPGYIAIAINSGVPSGPASRSGVFRMPPRKRVKAAVAAEGATGHEEN